MRGSPVKNTTDSSLRQTAGSLRPLLFIDVDGVIGCFGSGDGAPISDEWEVFGETLKAPEGTKERLNRLQKLFTCVYASTHERQAIEELSPLLALGESVDAVIWKNCRGESWKLADILAYARGRPFAWMRFMLTRLL